VHRRGQTVARCAGKVGKELVATESPNPASTRNGGRAKQWKQDRFPEGADRVKQLRREIGVAERFGAFEELPGGFSTCFHPTERLGLGCR
jgi:hypothetical protein